jgi:hypothetical protein
MAHPDAPFESYIRRDRAGTTLYVGELAIKLRRGQELRAFVASFNGKASFRKMLVLVTAFTGRRYDAQNAAERYRAIYDLDDWIRGMELVVPVIEEV